MKLKIVIAAVLLTTLLSVQQKTNAQIPNWMWAKSVGNSGNDLCESIAVDDSGNVYSTGSYEGTVDFDPGTGTFNLTSQGILDGFILKLDSAGNFVWAVSMGGVGTDKGFSIKVDYLGNVYTTGRYANTVDFDPGPGTFNLTSNGDKDVFVLKLNTNGNFLWAKSVGSTGDDEGFGITLDNLNNVLVTGFFQNTVDFNPDAGVYNLTSNGNYDAFILKLENNGSYLWSVSYGSNLNDDGSSLATDTSGNIYTTGYIIGTVDLDPGAGIYNLTTFGYMDIYILKLDAAGNFIWAKDMGGVQTENGMSIYSNAGGDVFTTGTFQGTSDFDPNAGVYNLTAFNNSDVFVSKLDNTGSFGWAGGMGGNQADYGYTITSDSYGNIYTTGIFMQTVDFDPGPGVFNLTNGINNDGFIQKLDAAGNFVWVLQIHGQYSDQPKCIAFDKNNHLYVGGHYMSHTLGFGNDTLTNTVNLGATADFFIAKLDSGLIVVNNVIANLQSSDTTFCEKNCIDFFDLSTNSPTSWQWYFPGANPATSTLQNPTGICYNSYGNYDVVLVACNANGCDSLHLTNFIECYQNPVDSIYQSNDTLYSMPALSYQWFATTGGLIAGATNQYFVPQQQGSYFCVVTNSSGCEGSSNVIVITGISDLQTPNGGIEIVPNPNNGLFDIIFANGNLKGNVEMNIYNTLGKIVYNTMLVSYQSQQLNLNDGIYFIKLSNSKETYWKKFVVKN